MNDSKADETHYIITIYIQNYPMSSLGFCLSRLTKYIPSLILGKLILE